MFDTTDFSSGAALHSAHGERERFEQAWKLTVALGILEGALGIRAGCLPSCRRRVGLVGNVQQQMLVAAAALREVDRPNKSGNIPLALAILGNQPNCAEFLLHSRAKLENVDQDIKIPAWMSKIITKRCHVIQ